MRERDCLGVGGVGVEILLIVLLILFNGTLAMAEIAVVSARKTRLRQRAENGDGAAAAALRLAEDPTRFLSTVQIGITLVGILAGAFGGATVAESLGASLATIPALAPYAGAIALTLVVAAITYLSLIFGELVPKRMAMTNAEVIAGLVARPMSVLSSAGSPLVSLLTLSTEAVLRLLGVRASDNQAVTEDDVRALLAEGTRAGVFEATEQDIVESVFELGEVRVGALMTPRPLVDWINLEDPPDTLWADVAASSHTYYPVGRGELDAVVGVLSAKDLLPRLLRGERPDPAEMVRPPLFLPENLLALRALERFQRVGPHVALVVDEHGSVIGLLTPTDVLEAMVGTLAPGGALAETGPVQREDGSWLLEGLMPLHEAAELLAIDEPAAARPAEVHTLGGLAMAALGRVPSPGDRFTWHGIDFEVLDMDGRRVDKLLAARATPPGAPGHAS